MSIPHPHGFDTARFEHQAHVRDAERFGRLLADLRPRPRWRRGDAQTRVEGLGFASFVAQASFAQARQLFGRPVLRAVGDPQVLGSPARDAALSDASLPARDGCCL